MGEGSKSGRAGVAGCALELTKGTTYTPFVTLFEGRLARINYYRYFRLQRQDKKIAVLERLTKGVHFLEDAPRPSQIVIC